MRYTVEINDRLVPVEITALGTGRYQVQIDGGAPKYLDASVDGDQVHLLTEQSSFRVVLGTKGTAQHAHTRGAMTQLTVLDSRTARRRASAGGGAAGAGAATVRSPMPGRIVSVLVTEGDTVTAGQGVVIVEAMKMENELRAEIDGVVSKIHVKPDDRVDGNAELINLTPSEVD